MRGKRSDFILYKLCCISQIHSSRKLEFNQWEMAIFDPHGNHTPWPITKKWYRWLRRRPLRLWQNWCKSVHGGLLGKWVKYNECFLFIYTFFHELIYRLDSSTDFYAWWLKRRALAQGCAFWRFRWHCSQLWGWNTPENPNFWGVNRRFQAKRAKYWKFYVIETTTSRSRRDIQAMWWWVISPF